MSNVECRVVALLDLVFCFYRFFKEILPSCPQNFFFFSVFYNVILLEKCFSIWRNYFSIKSYFTFSAKMFQAPSFGNVYYIQIYQ